MAPVQVLSFHSIALFFFFLFFFQSVFVIDMQHRDYARQQRTWPIYSAKSHGLRRHCQFVLSFLASLRRRPSLIRSRNRKRKVKGKKEKKDREEVKNCSRQKGRENWTNTKRKSNSARWWNNSDAALSPPRTSSSSSGTCLKISQRNDRRPQPFVWWARAAIWRVCRPARIR